MKAILLCAGYATRLYPLTINKPKPLLPIGGHPILEWVLDRLKAIETLTEVFVATNHRFAGHFEIWAKELNYPWPIQVVDDQTTSNENRLGAIGDLNFVLQKNRIGAEDLLVIAGDNFFDFDLKKFVAAAKKKRPHPVIAIFDIKDFNLAKQYGLVECSKDGQVLHFFEKPEDPSTTLVSCGIYWLPAESRVLLDKYLRDGHNSDQPGHYMHWLSQTDRLYATPLEGRWLDIGDPISYEKANALFREFQP